MIVTNQDMISFISNFVDNNLEAASQHGYTHQLIIKKYFCNESDHFCYSCTCHTAKD